MNIDKLKYVDSGNFFLIAGPCVIEGKEMVFEIADTLVRLSDKYHIPFLFKA